MALWSSKRVIANAKLELNYFENQLFIQRLYDLSKCVWNRAVYWLERNRAGQNTVSLYK